MNVACIYKNLQSNRDRQHADQACVFQRPLCEVARYMTYAVPTTNTFATLSKHPHSRRRLKFSTCALFRADRSKS